jgi:hypothetical protein
MRYREKQKIAEIMRCYRTKLEPINHAIARNVSDMAITLSKNQIAASDGFALFAMT